jgi:hypothetical protein
MTIIFDLEADSPDPTKANLKYHGDIDVDTGEVVMLPHNKNIDIGDRINKHKVLVGFNNKGYDNKLLERFGISTKYKIHFDLYECLAPNNFNSKTNKNRLADINPGLKMKNYKLKTFAEALGLDDEGSKGDIDYDIFCKNDWTEEEHQIIQKYLKQDLVLTKKLFDWYVGIFKPLEKYLKKEDVEKFRHLTCRSGGLAYKFICNQAGLDEEYEEREVAAELKKNSPRIEGGHHIHPKYEKVRGNIICRDFVSHYPTIFIMAQLHNTRINDAIELNLNERLRAKSSGDKATALALKVPLNSIYGICGNPTFKNIYNPHAASECTRIGRELLKRYAKTLEIGGFVPLYGFTDSVYCGIPKGLTSEDLNTLTKVFEELTRSEFEKPLDSYGLGVDGEYKFMWFIEKKDNNYLTVDKDNNIHVKGGLFNKNCPRCITKTFEEFISPRIVNDLDVDFTAEELFAYVINLLEDNPELAAQEFTVKKVKDYPSDTSIQYKISERYGPGRHNLIPNTSGIGVGISTSYCSLEEFKQNKLTSDNISKDRMLAYLKPFYSTKEEVFDLETQQ